MPAPLTTQEMNDLFSDDRYFRASHEKLNRAMQSLVNDHSIDNNTVIRALVINTILSDRHSKKVEDQNIFLTYVIITLTVISIILSIIQAWPIVFNAYQSIWRLRHPYTPVQCQKQLA